MTDARRQVTGWLREWFGWRDVIDLGNITMARGTEMLLPLWLRTWSAVKTPLFSFRSCAEAAAPGRRSTRSAVR